MHLKGDDFYVDDTTLGLRKEWTLAVGVLATFLVCDPIHIGHWQ
jgi:hypothetical protein